MNRYHVTFSGHTLGVYAYSPKQAKLRACFRFAVYKSFENYTNRGKEGTDLLFKEIMKGATVKNFGRKYFRKEYKRKFK